MIRFQVLKPKTIPEACTMLAENRGKARIIAGGHGILPFLKHNMIKPQFLVDINGIPGLDYIKETKEAILIGALTTNRSIQDSPIIKAKTPMLSDLEKFVGDVQTRNWGTVVGNICVSSPTSDLGPSLIALNASFNITGPKGKRTITVENFLVGYMKTALEPDEIVTEISIPMPAPHTGSVYQKERVRLTDSPIASGASAVTLDPRLKTVAAASIILQAVGPTPTRAKEAEQLLIGQKVTNGSITPAALESVTAAAVAAAKPISDVYGSAEYKKAMIGLVVQSTVTEAVKRAYLAR